MKKTPKLLMIIVLVSAILLTAVYALPDFGTLDYWYSDSSFLGMFTPTPKFYVTYGFGFGMTTSAYQDAVAYGFNAWQSFSGQSFTSGDASNYNVKVQGVSRSAATSAGYDANAAAATITTDTSIATATYSGQTKYIKAISKSTITVIWDTSNTYTKTSDFSQGKWNAILAHEYGHLLGYYGHDYGATSSNPGLMAQSSYDIFGVTLPTTRDITHLGQTY